MTRGQHNLKYVWIICLVAAMGGLLFGYDWVVIGGAKPFYEPFFGISGDENAWLSGWAMSSALLGCLVGALVSGLLTDRVGRKKALIVAAIMFTVSAVWTAISQSFDGFIAARILGGIGIGLASNVSPMYIAEISPAKMRGTFVSINQLTIVVGVLAAQIVNLTIYQLAPVEPDATVIQIMESWNGRSGWRWMFGAETIPAGLFFLSAWFVPESPRWLMQKNRRDEAANVLAKIGGDEYASQEAVRIATALSSDRKQTRIAELLQPGLSKILWLGVFLAMFQQWCGINVIFNYAEEIFRSAGYDVSGMMFSIVITGIVNLVFTFAAIKTVDRWGRRPLMMMGSCGLMIMYALLGTCYFLEFKGVVVLVVVLAAIACYAMTLAPITWVLLSELFPNRIRGAAMSICVSALWIACFALTVTFKPINAALGPEGTFWFYGVICLIGFAVIFQNLPETKSKSLEELEQELVG